MRWSGPAPRPSRDSLWLLTAEVRSSRADTRAAAIDWSTGVSKEVLTAAWLPAASGFYRSGFSIRSLRARGRAQQFRALRQVVVLRVGKTL